MVVAVSRGAVIAVGGPAALVAVAAGVKWYRSPSFAEAAAAGDFERAERRAGVLTFNDPSASFGLLLLFVAMLAIAASEMEAAN
jgi:hypothetical protein